MDEFEPAKKATKNRGGLWKYVVGTMTVSIPSAVALWQILPEEWRQTLSKQLLPTNIKASGVTAILSLSHAAAVLSIQLMPIVPMLLLLWIMRARIDAFSPQITKYNLSILEANQFQDQLGSKKTQ